MAKILFSAFSNINWINNTAIDPFYEGFINSLIEHGNEVMLLRSNDFLRYRANNTLNSTIDSAKLLQAVNKFNPDFIIAANHVIPQIILDNTTVPVAVWTSDSPEYYDAKEYIKKNISRYTFLHHGWNNHHTNLCQEMFAAKKEQNFSIGYATNLKARNNTIESNIAFIGTLGYADKIKNYLKKNCNNIDIRKMDNIFLKIKQDPFNIILEDLKELPLELYDYFYTLTSNNRIKTLDHLSDLGLKVYGYPDNFFEVVPYSIDLALCFDYTQIITTKDTEKVLNSTKIGINLYSAHAVTGVSWRCADVMASNACLIAHPSPDLNRLNPYMKIPTFTTPQEARELCQKLLKDDQWRKDIVTSSQKSIEKHGRFEHVFKIIEEILNVQLLNNKQAADKQLVFLEASDFIKPRLKILVNLAKHTKKSTVMHKIMIKFLRLIPRNLLRDTYNYIAKIKNELQ